MPRTSPLLRFLSQGTLPPINDGESASLLVAEARAAGVQCRLAINLEKDGKLRSLGDSLAEQMSGAITQANEFKREVQRELVHIEHALSRIDAPAILLKGAAYALLDLPPAEGRLFSDIDVLVPVKHIAQAEAALMLGGWSTGKLSDYDQRYYRQWAHEIPPMIHHRRGTTIDLHHSLVMPTCRLRVDSEAMIAAAIPSGLGKWYRLRDEDMVLHAAAHLLMNSEFHRGLRDLWDIDLLYRHFDANTSGFATRLFSRAQQVGLQGILEHTLVLTKKVFGTPVPDDILPKANDLVLRILARSISTRHPDTRPSGQNTADALLAIREMYLRLPWRLLLVHLSHKAATFFSPTEPVETKTAA
ncbi:nucleotidyltransferase family protein [Propionivibrio soli]|uniref:nucleotidyltransferase domain-containing protein n=1 Tax=Propionivibrio soli TaxID=2976531 RepID=UPI0021E73761